MVDISPVRNSPTIRRRKRLTQAPTLSRAGSTSHYYYSRYCGVACCCCVATLAVLCLWQTTTGPHHPTATSHSHSHSHYLRSTPPEFDFDVIVVGSGLAGLTTTLQVLDRGGRVALVEKEATLGGNSVKASSGINGCCRDNTETIGDSLEAFMQDTTRSAGTLAQPPLIKELVDSSAATLQWLQERVGVDLSQIAQLGGHSFPRTHRPAEGMVGAELIVHLEQLVRTYDHPSASDGTEEGQVTIYTQHPVIQLLPNNNKNEMQIQGVRLRNIKTNATTLLTAPQVVLATGGFASDRRPTSLLGQVRPDLIDFGTTGGSFSTGDGIPLATSLGAGTTDLDQIQLHPTGFINPQHPQESTKVLAAELLRGVGGLLLSPQGKRFCNELGTRDYVTQQMLQQQAENKSNAFVLLLTQEMAQKAQTHVDLYHRKGLLTQVKGVAALAEWMGLPQERLLETFQRYQEQSVQGVDEFGKTGFSGFSWMNETDQQQQQQVFFVGKVTPVLHYCMGGLSIDAEGHVLNDDAGTIIQGLFAAGEVAGGVHGKNRLGGNSLLECAVYGRKIGQQLVLRHSHNDSVIPKHHQPGEGAVLSPDTGTVITLEELQQHTAKNDLWMALHGIVYNLTAFASQHPGGASIIETLAGTDATEAFATAHSQSLLQQFNAQPSVVMGKLDPAAAASSSNAFKRSVSHSELQQHSTKEDCWVAFHGHVYDMTDFSKSHKGGAYLIQKYAGKDATDSYKAFHKKEKLALVAKSLVGVLEQEAVE